jgi:hypothetical protein
MRGQLKFLAETSAPPYFAPSVGGSDAQSTLVGDFEMRDVEILDARALDEDFSLDTHGFELRTVSEVGDLYDPEVVSSKHEPQCRELVTAVTGASRVDIFDHTWRSDAADTRGQHGSREPSSFVIRADNMAAVSLRPSSTTTTRRGRRPNASSIFSATRASA